MKITVDANRKRLAQTVAVYVPKNCELVGLITSTPHIGCALIKAGDRYYSCACAVLTPINEKEIEVKL